ncbi:hypothetical protein FNV43_RR13914 [Rhamnella rubrinervis]|uniref:Patellin-3 n=1 Tax=Rhamnella rubrinervis TaxID=2594499 RepID=A0A8K0H218_9ROSA|nr:hypothetical protein FNV43_RR13914 [Rhamnella rubrinervis]
MVEEVVQKSEAVAPQEEEVVQKSEAVAPQEEEVVVVTDVPQANAQKEAALAEAVVTETNKDHEALVDQPPSAASDQNNDQKPGDTNVNDDKIPESSSFKEESNKVADLPDPERKALDELKQLVQQALNKHEFTALVPPSPPKQEAVEEKKEPLAEVEEQKPVESPVPAAPEDASTPALEPEPETKGEAAEKEKITTADQLEVIEEKVAAPAHHSADDDGAKTVEAIEETIVAVSSSSAPEKEPEESKAAQALEAEPKDNVKDQAPLAAVQPPEEVSIWGIPLLADERSDVVLLKFLRARDFKVKDAFTMIKNTVRWRKQFGIDELVEEELENDIGLDKVVFMHGVDKEGHPVCYNVYGEFQSKELYQKTFSDEEKRQKFLRWRIRFLEKSIRKLDFSPGGVCTIVQVNDLKNSPGPGKWELRQATKQALQLLQDNYPEFVAKQVFINVPWWYLAVNRMISPFLTQRTKSKFVFAGPSKSAETLLRYIAAEQIPVKYGGLSIDGEFGTADTVTEIIVKPANKHTVEFPVTEKCLLTWEVRVVGWEVNYGAEFVPSAEESYTVIIQKARKVASTEEPVVSNSFKVGEPGKVVLTLANPTNKKKKLLYRFKTKASEDTKQKC